MFRCVTIDRCDSQICVDLCLHFLCFCRISVKAAHTTMSDNVYNDEPSSPMSSRSSSSRSSRSTLEADDAGVGDVGLATAFNQHLPTVPARRGLQVKLSKALSTPCPEKKCRYIFASNFAKYGPIFKILSSSFIDKFSSKFVVKR